MARIRPRYRQGRCYELSWRYLLFDERFEDWALVHGTVVSPIGNGDAIGHAWLKCARDGTIYDPVLDLVMGATEYAAKYRAIEVACYNRIKAAAAALAEKATYGPWRADVPPQGPLVNRNVRRPQVRQRQQ